MSDTNEPMVSDERLRILRAGLRYDFERQEKHAADGFTGGNNMSRLEELRDSIRAINELQRLRALPTCRCGTYPWPADAVRIEDSVGMVHSVTELCVMRAKV